MRPLFSEERLLKALASRISAPIERVGLLARVYSRVKSPESIEQKIKRKNYVVGGRLLQDAMGARVACYFLDDLVIVRDLLVQTFSEPVDEVRDDPDPTTFQPTRWNLVFGLPSPLREDFALSINGRPIDSTFEVQLRSVLAEGWHEVEHDLRYKRPEDWTGEPEASRTLNGLLAALENADWTMLQLFDGLAYEKYKAKQWESMLIMKFRLRLAGQLSEPVNLVLSTQPGLAKRLFRANRAAVLRRIGQLEMIPLTFDNFVFLLNRVAGNDQNLKGLEPAPLRQLLSALELPLADGDD